MSRGTSREETSRFWLGYLIFLLFLILFWVWLVWYVAGCMTVYEDAQPEYTLQALSRQLLDGEAGALLKVEQLTRFEDEESCARRWLAGLEGKTLTWEKDPNSYDAAAPVYNLYAGGALAASAALRESGRESLMLVLSVPRWEVVEITPILGSGRGTLVVRAPDTFTVKINGIQADERELTAPPAAIDEFRYAAEYIDVPALAEYRVEGLVAEPRVEIFDPWGGPVAFERSGEGAVTVTQWPEGGEPDGELAALVLKNAKDYSNFFSADLAGSAGSVAPLRAMFPPDSDYLTLAENYRRHDMWMYTPHYAPVFTEETVDGYVPYSDDFFSCRVRFDKAMVLIRTGEERHVIHNTRYYYVKLDGKWVIADMREVLD